MKIKHTIEKEDGSLELSADLSPDEVAFVIELGINMLLARGVMPFQVDNEASVITTSEAAH